MSVIAALGASSVFTTIFSTDRGRLDILIWSFTSFSIAVIGSLVLQSSIPPPRLELAEELRQQFSILRHSILSFAVGIPMVLGFYLLAYGIWVLENEEEQSIPASAATIIAAAGVLAYTAALLLTVYLYGGASNPHSSLVKSFLRKIHRITTRKCDLTDVNHPLYILPGGRGYDVYRQKHRELPPPKSISQSKEMSV